MKFSEFIYKRIDLEETKKKIQEITEKLKHAQSGKNRCRQSMR
ncbi:hypothetical protein F120042H4_19710 [Faecalimonas umbilicata]